MICVIIDYIDFRPKNWWIVGIWPTKYGEKCGKPIWGDLFTQIGSMADGMGFAGLKAHPTGSELARVSGKANSTVKLGQT